MFGKLILNQRMVSIAYIYSANIVKNLIFFHSLGTRDLERKKKVFYSSTTLRIGSEEGDL